MSRLGRGLNALISDVEHVHDKSSVNHVNVMNIQPNRYQPRKSFDAEKLQDLAQSIKENGLIQPIIVTQLDQDKYELIAGERRLEASKIAGLAEVPVIIRKVSEKEQLVLAIIENIQREDLNAIDEAKAYQQLADEFNLTHSEISDIMGKDRATITNTLRLLKLSDELQNMILSHRITPGHARAILQLDTKYQQEFAEHIEKKALSVRQAEVQAKNYDEHKQTQNSPATEIKEEIIQKEALHSLSTKYNTKVSVKAKNNKGQLIFHFQSEQELNDLIECLRK